MRLGISGRGMLMVVGYDKYVLMIERKKCRFWKVEDRVLGGGVYEVFEGAPCEWSCLLGATHTLLDDVGALPCKLKKSVMYIGRGNEGEDEGIVWERRGVRAIGEDTANIVIDRGVGVNRFRLGREWEGIGRFDVEMEIEVELDEE
jgi:hypothetical protein